MCYTPAQRILFMRCRVESQVKVHIVRCYRTVCAQLQLLQTSEWMCERPTVQHSSSKTAHQLEQLSISGLIGGLRNERLAISGSLHVEMSLGKTWTPHYPLIYSWCDCGDNDLYTVVYFEFTFMMTQVCYYMADIFARIGKKQKTPKNKKKNNFPFSLNVFHFWEVFNW